MSHIFDKYLLKDKLPTIWCSGCGNGIVLQSLLRAIDAAGLDQDKTVLVAGIGCCCRANGYTDFCGIHGNHGRALAYATGMKLHDPSLHVVVLMGDGDCASIGGNHFIHAARRNIGLTAVVFNNKNYGMTGGQYSPTTPVDSRTKTSLYGNIEPDFDLCALAASAGASYVARSTTYHVRQLIDQLTRALTHPGFSVVEAMCDCPTLYGRLNKQGAPADMMLRWKDGCVTRRQAEGLGPEELADKVVIGEFVDQVRPEYTAQYDRLIARAKEGAR